MPFLSASCKSNVRALGSWWLRRKCKSIMLVSLHAPSPVSCADVDVDAHARTRKRTHSRLARYAHVSLLGVCACTEYGITHARTRTAGWLCTCMGHGITLTSWRPQTATLSAPPTRCRCGSPRPATSLCICWFHHSGKWPLLLYRTGALRCGDRKRGPPALLSLARKGMGGNEEACCKGTGIDDRLHYCCLQHVSAARSHPVQALLHRQLGLIFGDIQLGLFFDGACAYVCA